MTDGKWIEELRPSLPLAVAARITLTARLRVVNEYLPLALHHREDAENVHHLRVATRRTDAALRIFRDCLPRKAFKKARRRLRRLRRAAGAARDWDVFALDLAERHEQRPAKEKPGLALLLGYALGCRDVAQEELEAAAGDECAQAETLTQFVIAAVRPPSEPSQPALGDVALPELTALRQALGCAAAGDLKDYAQLHQVRIAGKRLRYAMEVFADCFAPPFKERLYPMIEELQEILGRANDSHVASERLSGLRQRLRSTWGQQWKEYRPGVEALLRFHQRRLPQERKRFLTWWKKWERAVGMIDLGEPAA